MSTLMLSHPSSRGPAFITPLSRDDLFDVGAEFSRDELTRRILSVFWRDCCCPPCFSRAPAPVVELTAPSPDAGEAPRRVRAWWLLQDGIIEDNEGPHSDRLRPFFGELGRSGQLWPRYEFRIRTDLLLVEMSIYQEPLVGRGLRTHFTDGINGRLRVTAQEPWWGR